MFPKEKVKSNLMFLPLLSLIFLTLLYLVVVIHHHILNLSIILDPDSGQALSLPPIEGFVKTVLADIPEPGEILTTAGAFATLYVAVALAPRIGLKKHSLEGLKLFNQIIGSLSFLLASYSFALVCLMAAKFFFTGEVPAVGDSILYIAASIFFTLMFSYSPIDEKEIKNSIEEDKEKIKSNENIIKNFDHNNIDIPTLRRVISSRKRGFSSLVPFICENKYLHAKSLLLSNTLGTISLILVVYAWLTGETFPASTILVMVFIPLITYLVQIITWYEIKLSTVEDGESRIKMDIPSYSTPLLIIIYSPILLIFNGAFLYAASSYFYNLLIDATSPAYGIVNILLIIAAILISLYIQIKICKHNKKIREAYSKYLYEGTSGDIFEYIVRNEHAQKMKEIVTKKKKLLSDE